ncbi:5prime-3prime exoribonuclease 2 [Diplonema papillatum]|nr:5prime-3prime exoribonuclease 2 [Diplonema papillatum]
MGVSGLARTLHREYRKAVGEPAAGGAAFGVVGVELNSLLHSAADTAVSVDDAEGAVRAGLVARLDAILRRAVPPSPSGGGAEQRTRIGLFMDGPPPWAKLAVQRVRRKKYADELGSGTFNRMHLSPGTDFMKKAFAAVQDWAAARLRGGGGRLEFVLSSSEVPGEGEAKIVRWLRSLPPGHPRHAIMVVTCDTDLLLALYAQDILPNALLFNPKDGLAVCLSTIAQQHVALFPAQLPSPLLTRTETADFLLSLRRDFVALHLLAGTDCLPRLAGASIADTWRAYAKQKKAAVAQYAKKRSGHPNGAAPAAFWSLVTCEAGDWRLDSSVLAAVLRKDAAKAAAPAAGSRRKKGGPRAQRSAGAAAAVRRYLSVWLAEVRKLATGDVPDYSLHHSQPAPGVDDLLGVLRHGSGDADAFPPFVQLPSPAAAGAGAPCGPALGLAAIVPRPFHARFLAPRVCAALAAADVVRELEDPDVDVTALVATLKACFRQAKLPEGRLAADIVLGASPPSPTEANEAVASGDDSCAAAYEKLGSCSYPALLGVGVDWELNWGAAQTPCRAPSPSSSPSLASLAVAVAAIVLLVSVALQGGVLFPGSGDVVCRVMTELLGSRK